MTLDHLNAIGFQGTRVEHIQSAVEEVRLLGLVAILHIMGLLVLRLELLLESLFVQVLVFLVDLLVVVGVEFEPGFF